MPISPAASALPLIAMLTLLGAAINGVQVAMYVLAAHVYPTAIRATGVGTAVAFGRIGAVLTGYVGSWAIDFGRHHLLLQRRGADDARDVRRAGRGEAVTCRRGAGSLAQLEALKLPGRRAWELRDELHPSRPLVLGELRPNELLQFDRKRGRALDTRAQHHEGDRLERARRDLRGRPRRIPGRRRARSAHSRLRSG